MPKTWTKQAVVLLGGAGLALLLAGCAGPGTTTTPQMEYEPNMYVQPYVQPLGTDIVNPKQPAMRLPPAHTIPLNYTPFPQGNDLANVDTMIDPLPINRAVIAKGRWTFDHYCIVCHGARADGLGYIVPKMTQPPPLIVGAPLQFSDGRIFTIITEGQGNMPPYATELTPAQRWAVVHYVRVLQLAANPGPEGLAAGEAQGMNFSQDYPPAEGVHGPIPGTEAIPH